MVEFNERIPGNQTETHTGGKAPLSSDWENYDSNGRKVYNKTTSRLVGTAKVEGQEGPFTTMGDPEPFLYPSRDGGFRELNDSERLSIGSGNVLIDDSVIEGFTTRNVVSNPNKLRELLMEDTENIQNPSAFPIKVKDHQGLLTAKYDYQIIPGDRRYKKALTLEDKLKEARASFGLHVHGNNNIARGVKYYMYNRFKSPDINLAFNKMVTHVFFTRPDLNLLTYNSGQPGTANDQVKRFSDASMLWRLNPSLFKLLTHHTRCGDDNNFNMLLSNQITSWEFPEERLGFTEVGKSWNEFAVSYGDSFTGRQGGEITCNFDEVSDLSVIQMLRLWMVYIDNVSRGIWKPSYNLYGSKIATSSHRASHVYMRALDYAASIYVFKCAPDGETVLFWDKYYGVFPTATGATSLSWDGSEPIGSRPKLSIPFRYSWRRPMSPISLIEFNMNSNISANSLYINSENSFNANYNHSSRPFVGKPFIEFDLAKSINLRSNGVNFSDKNSTIRLKFTKTSDTELSDDLLYRYDFSKK